MSLRLTSMQKTVWVISEFRILTSFFFENPNIKVLFVLFLFCYLKKKKKVILVGLLFPWGLMHVAGILCTSRPIIDKQQTKTQESDGVFSMVN